MTQTHAAPEAIMAHEDKKPETANQPDRIYSTAEICELIGCNRVTLWRMCRDNRFPKPLEITGNKRGWPRSDYDRWLADQIAKRDAR